ncbi:hypothetical protein H4S01_004168 [Coemansia sp. RSA 2610]|nr:hypothetical protein H4S01_004168 [Coemansia sp. RSA 2610]
MLGPSFFRTCPKADDMPPADWCITTLQTLTNKYEHLTSVRKANPPFAEAVLNSFKSKLLNVVSSQSLYDSEDSSDVETEWPLGSDCAAPYMDMKADEYSTSNYLSLTPAAVADSASADCYSEGLKPIESGIGNGLLSPSLSPEGESSTDVDSASLAASDDMVMLPPSIEEALRRFLANNSSQVMSDTFTTFAAPGGGLSAEADTDKSHDTAAAADEEEDNSDAQYIAESGSCSPESLDEPPEYLSSTDSVDIFVKGFSANGSWEAVPHLQPADGSLTPCKRKRNTDKEDQQAEDNTVTAKTIPRNTLQVSPRKRSRSTSHGDAAAVPSSEQTSAVAA